MCEHLIKIYRIVHDCTLTSLALGNHIMSMVENVPVAKLIWQNHSMTFHKIILRSFVLIIKKTNKGETKKMIANRK